MATKGTIGILETRGFAPLIQGADAAVKAANVELVEWRQVGSGYVSFMIEGDVASVLDREPAHLGDQPVVGIEAHGHDPLIGDFGF